MFTRKDLYFSIITGSITGFIAWRIFEFLNIPILRWGYIRTICGIVPPCWDVYKFSVSWVALIVFIPVFWILGVNLGYFLGRWLVFFNQFGKFAAVGFTNAAVYFGILNVLIYFSDINKGFWYSVFVALAFILGTVHSYFWNKFWVFSATEDKISGEEFGKFAGVSIVAGLINIGIASFVVNFINPVFGFTLDQWANIGGVVGSAVALAASFVGFRLAVFKK